MTNRQFSPVSLGSEEPWALALVFYSAHTELSSLCCDLTALMGISEKRQDLSAQHWFSKGTQKPIIIHYVCNTCFHLLWRRKFAAFKSKSLCHESNDDITSLAIPRSNLTKTFWKHVLLEWIRMVIPRFVFEWFADINCIILRSQMPALPLRWPVAVKLNLRP